MSFNKRKIFASDTSDEDDSFNHQHSSLRVNLSYSKNLTDSGNGSLWRTEIKNDQGEMNTARTIKRLSRKKSMYEKNHQSDFNNRDMQAINDTDKYAVDKNNDNSIRIKKGIQLKRLTINLEDVSTKERYLETNCNRLKDAILSKTKQIFDKENELSVKITNVLGNKKISFASSIHNRNIGNETVMLDMTDLKETAAREHQQYTHNEFIVNDQKRDDQYSNIVTTPSNNDRQRSLEKNIDKSRLTQRRLFVEKNKLVKGQTKCKIIEDVVLKKNFPLVSLRQATQSSPILSGSNKRFSLVRRSKLHSQNKIENLNNTFSTIHSVQNFNIETPVVCSTFIEDNATDEKEINDVDASRATHTTIKVTSMEMTEVHGGIHMSEKRISVQNRNSYMNNYNENKEEKSKKESIERNKTGISSRLKDELINKITESDVLQAHEHDSKAKCQNEKCNMMSLSNSNNTIRSSLNVNTSLDADVTEINKARDVWESRNHRTDNTNQNFEVINNKESVILNDQRESTNTNRTSLQMNTSVDFMHKWRRRSNKSDKDHSSMDMECSSTGDKEINDIDSLENISLTERLKNISMKNEKISHKPKSKIFKMKNEDKRHSSNTRDGYNYVEGTLYPINRSVLFKSQLKYKTQHLDNTGTCSNLNSLENKEKSDETKSFAL